MHFSFDLTKGYFQYQGTDSDAGFYQSVWCQTHNDITVANNDISFGGLYKHYH